MINHFEALGIDPQTADAEAVRKAYKKAAREVHPDCAGGSLERMQEITAAWSFLKDESRLAMHRKAVLKGQYRSRAATWLAAPSPDAEKAVEFSAGDRRSLDRVLLAGSSRLRRRDRAARLRAGAMLDFRRALRPWPLPALHLPDGMHFDGTTLIAIYPSRLATGSNLAVLPGLRWGSSREVLYAADQGRVQHFEWRGPEAGILSRPSHDWGWQDGPEVRLMFEGHEAPLQQGNASRRSDDGRRKRPARVEPEVL